MKHFSMILMVAILFTSSHGFADWKPSWLRKAPLKQVQAEEVLQNAVTRGSDSFYIENGHVVKISGETGTVEYIDKSGPIKAIVLYKNHLLSLEDVGIIRILIEKTRGSEWFQLGQSAKQLISLGDDLLALSADGGLWIYQDTEKDLTITFKSLFVSSSNFSYNKVMVPLINGNQMTFADTHIRSAVSILYTPEQNDILIKYSQGQETLQNLKQRLGI